MRGRFITLEGIDGCGKSGHAPYLKACLEGIGLGVRLTREPGGTRLGEKIRELLLAGEVVPRAELLLLGAARAQHVEERILPALEAGLWVLCDRFSDSTYAYQGGGRALGKAAAAMVESLSCGTLEPDLTLLLDLDPEVGLRRKKSQAGPQAGPGDAFEREGVDFLHRVREAYLERGRDAGKRVRIVDASKSEEEVQRALGNIVLGFARDHGVS